MMKVQVLPAPSAVPASLSAGKPLLTREGVLATVGVSWPGGVVEAAEASSSVLSSSVSEGTMLTFRLVALVETSRGRADASAGAFTACREGL